MVAKALIVCMPYHVSYQAALVLSRRVQLKWPLAMVVDGESVLDTKLRMANIELINTIGVSKENLTACLECHCPGAAFHCALKLSLVEGAAGPCCSYYTRVPVQLRHIWEVRLLGKMGAKEAGGCVRSELPKSIRPSA